MRCSERLVKQGQEILWRAATLPIAGLRVAEDLADVPKCRRLCLFQEFGLEDEPLHLFRAALDFVGFSCKANILDQSAALRRLGCPFDLQILDERHGVAIGELGAVAVLHNNLVRHIVSLLTLADLAAWPAKDMGQLRG